MLGDREKKLKKAGEGLGVILLIPVFIFICAAAYYIYDSRLWEQWTVPKSFTFSAIQSAIAKNSIDISNVLPKQKAQNPAVEVDRQKPERKPVVRVYNKAVAKVNPCMAHRWIYNICYTGEADAESHTVVLGDSHAITSYVAHTMLPPEALRNRRISIFVCGDCRPFYECKFIAGDCLNFTRSAFLQLRNMTVNRVVIAARYLTTSRQIHAHIKDVEKAKQKLEDCFMSSVKRLMDMGIPDIVLVMQVPEAEHNVPERLAKYRKFSWDLRSMNIIRESHEEMTKTILEVMTKVTEACPVCTLIDPAKALCDEKYCYTLSSYEEPVFPLYIDDNHLNDHGIKKISSLFS